MRNVKINNVPGTRRIIRFRSDTAAAVCPARRIRQGRANASAHREEGGCRESRVRWENRDRLEEKVRRDRLVPRDHKAQKDARDRKESKGRRGNRDRRGHKE